MLYLFSSSTIKESVRKVIRFFFCLFSIFWITQAICEEDVTAQLGGEILEADQAQIVLLRELGSDDVCSFQVARSYSVQITSIVYISNKSDGGVWRSEAKNILSSLQTRIAIPSF